jgi:hypothetical protein
MRKATVRLIARQGSNAPAQVGQRSGHQPYMTGTPTMSGWNQNTSAR